MTANTNNTKWLVWSNQHGQWWASHGMGYRHFKKDAGRYSYSDACQIVKEANIGRDTPNESMVLDEN